MAHEPLPTPAIRRHQYEPLQSGEVCQVPSDQVSTAYHSFTTLDPASYGWSRL
jgi:hypothetical protein